MNPKKKNSNLISKIIGSINKRADLKKALFNFNWLLLERILFVFLGIFIGAWVARYLGPKKFGVLSYCLAFITLFSPLVNLGLNNIVVRDIVSNPDKTDIILGSSFVCKIIGALLLVLATIATTYILDPSDTELLILISIVALGNVFKIFEVITFWFQSQVKSKYVAISNISANIVVSSLKVGFILMGASLLPFVAMLSLNQLLLFLLLVIFYQLKSNSSIFKWRFSIRETKALLQDSWPLMLSTIAIIIYMKIDQVMIGQMLGDEELGCYSAAVRLSEALNFLPMAITGSIFPALIKIRNKSQTLFLKRMQTVFDVFLWGTIAIAMFITFTSPFIINLLYGDKYHNAATVLNIHIWSSVFVFLGVASGKYLVAENLTKISLYRTLAGAALNIVLNIVFIPKWNIYGAAIATLISYATANIIALFFFKRTKQLLFMHFKALNAFRIVAQLTRHKS